MASKCKTLNFIDLFSGAGGFTEGFLQASTSELAFNLLGGSDHQINAEKTYLGRFRDQLALDCFFLCKNIRDEDFLDQLKVAIGRNRVDIICGGPPCQGFSVFGKRNEEDPRNDLFRHYLKVIEALTPKYFIMENVKGLAVMYGGKTVQYIKDAVANIKGGYKVNGPILVNATQFGVPQSRERIIFIGSREDMPEVPVINPTHPGKPLTLQDAIGDLAFLKAGESAQKYDSKFNAVSHYQLERRKGILHRPPSPCLYNHEAAKHSEQTIQRFALIPVGSGVKEMKSLLKEKGLETAKRWCVRMRPDAPSYTMVTLPDDFIHYSRNRILTVREMARIQSFDDSFMFYGPKATGGGGVGNKKRNQELPQYTQVGNAVPPLLAKGVALSLGKAYLNPSLYLDEVVARGGC